MDSLVIFLVGLIVIAVGITVAVVVVMAVAMVYRRKIRPTTSFLRSMDYQTYHVGTIA